MLSILYDLARVSLVGRNFLLQRNIFIVVSTIHAHYRYWKTKYIVYTKYIFVRAMGRGRNCCCIGTGGRGNQDPMCLLIPGSKNIGIQ